MSEEYLDVFNENNQPTGEKALRSFVHAQGLWHRTVHIYLFREKEKEIEFLVHLRSKLKDTSPNMWARCFGGHLEAGVGLEEGAIKELQEEVGLEINNFQNLIEREWRKHEKFPNNEFIKVYYLRYDGEVEDLKLNDGEVQLAKWMNVKEMKEEKEKEPEKWAGSMQGLLDAVGFLQEKIK